MQIECCNIKHRARCFMLPSKNRIWRVFLFVDECYSCGKAIAEVKELKMDGKTTLTPHRWTGNKAIEKLNKYMLESIEIRNKIPNGAKSKMDWHFIDGSTTIYDFNGRKVGKFETHLNTFHMPEIARNIAPR